MSNGFFSKIGRALSIFGVSNPDDVRKMQHRKTPPSAVKPASAAVPSHSAKEAAAPPKPTLDE